MRDAHVFHLRLAASAALMTLWAYSQLFPPPLLGRTLLPLILSSAVAPGWDRRYKPTPRFWAITWTAAVAIIASVFLCPHVGEAFSLSSPWFVGPLWLMGLAGLAKRGWTRHREAADPSLKPKPFRGSA